MGKTVITVTSKAKGKNKKKLSKKLTLTVKSSVKLYYEGQYKVGVNLPAGDYIAYPTDSLGGFFEITSDANGSDIIAIDNFDGQRYFSVKNGEYLTLHRCEARKVSDKIKFNYKSGKTISDGQYLVGDDIPAGEYLAKQTGSSGGYYAICSDANGENIIANDFFNGQSYFTLKNGEYLLLSRCEALCTEEKGNTSDPVNGPSDNDSTAVKNQKKLRDYILKYGSKNDQGYQYIMRKDNKVIASVMYEAESDSLLFGMTSDSDVTTAFELQIGTTNYVGFIMSFTGSNIYGKAYTDINMKSYYYKQPMDFTIMSSTGTTEEQVNNIANTALNLAMSSYDFLLEREVGFNLKDIGFESYQWVSSNS